MEIYSHVSAAQQREAVEVLQRAVQRRLRVTVRVTRGHDQKLRGRFGTLVRIPDCT